MPALISINVQNSKPDPSDPTEEPTLESCLDAGVTFVPASMVRTNPPATSASGLEPYWECDWQPVTYLHDSDGHYLPDPTKKGPSGEDNPALDPQPGEWLLVVRADGYTPVSQRLTLKNSNGVLLATPGWASSALDRGLPDAQRTAATVNIVNYKKAKNADKGETTLITVVLWPRREVVFMAGADYATHSMHFMLFGDTRRQRLFEREQVDSGTRFACLDCMSGRRFLLVKAQQAWIVTQENPAMSADPKSPQRMGILELYRYLDCVGFEAPGTVQEASIFSHAYGRGPILWNTYDCSNHATRRDPEDLDGRAKDWQAGGVMAHYPNVANAFAQNGYLKTWGCFFDAHLQACLHNANARASRHADRDAYYEVTSWGHSQRTIECVSDRALRASIQRTFSGPPANVVAFDTAAAQYLRRRVFGAPPGNESNFIKNVMLVIDTDPTFTYLAREFGVRPKDRDDSNHMDFSVVANPTIDDPPWFSGRWKKYSNEFPLFGGSKPPMYIVALPSNVAMLRDGRPSPPAYDVQTASGLLDANLSGHLYIAQKARPERLRRLAIRDWLGLFMSPSPGEDAAIYVQSDRTFVLLTRPHGGNAAWTIDTRPLLEYLALRLPSGWQDQQSPTRTVTDGIVARDTVGILW